MDNKGIYDIVLVFILAIVILIAVFVLFYFEAMVSQSELEIYGRVSELQKADNMRESIENCFKGLESSELLLANEKKGPNCVKEPFSGYTVKMEPLNKCGQKTYTIGAWAECENQYSYYVSVWDNEASQQCLARMVICIDGVAPPEIPKICELGETISCGNFGNCTPNTIDSDSPETDNCYCQPGARTCTDPETGFGECEGFLGPIAENSTGEICGTTNNCCSNSIDDDCDGLIDSADSACAAPPVQKTICLGEGRNTVPGQDSKWVLKTPGSTISYNKDWTVIDEDLCASEDGIYMLNGSKGGTWFDVRTPDLGEAPYNGSGWYELSFGYTNGSCDQYAENFQLKCKDETGAELVYNFWDEGNGCPGGRQTTTTKTDPNNTANCSTNPAGIVHNGDIIIKNSNGENEVFWTHIEAENVHESLADGSPPPSAPWFRKCYFTPNANGYGTFRIYHPGCGSCPSPCRGPASIRFSGYKIKWSGA